MKKYAGIIAVIVFLVLMVFMYLQIGKKGADAGKTYVEDSKGYMDQAQKSVDALNKSAEESKKAADMMQGK